MSERSDNTTWHHGEVDRKARAEAFGHGGITLWLTGLSGSGKSTLARGLEAALVERGVFVVVLDGDNVRHGLSGDLGFSASDRDENIRRVTEVAKLLAESGAVVLAAFISPTRAQRERVRTRHLQGDFLEAFVDCDLSVCESRDPKGLYVKARAGEIPSFTGITAPYEPPLAPDVVVDTADQTLDESVAVLLGVLAARGIIGEG